MKFNLYKLRIKSKEYFIYEAVKVPKQLRCLYSPNNISTILANAEGYKFLRKIFVLAAKLKKENCLFIINDSSEETEEFHNWYLDAEFHKNIIINNNNFCNMSWKLFNRLIEMKVFSKSEIIDLKEINLDKLKSEFDKLVYWKYKNKLRVNFKGKWAMLASNYDGLLYMARSANYFENIADDPKEYFAHTHLYLLTYLEDILDFRYFYET